MPIFPDYRNISCQKLKQNKWRYSQKLSKSTRHSQKSLFSSSDPTDQKSNATEQNPELNTGRESILCSTKQASVHVDKAIKQCLKHL